MTREEHLAWCKKRALEYCDRGEFSQALASMGSDLNSHDQTRDHAGLSIGLLLMMAGDLNTEPKMRRFIEGFN